MPTYPWDLPPETVREYYETSEVRSMETNEIDPTNDELIGELMAEFVIAAGMTGEEISYDSDIHKGIRAVTELLSRK